MMNIFIGHSWIFELNHNVFELGHLNSINILNAPTIMESLEDLSNNSVSAHKYFQNLIKMI